MKPHILLLLAALPLAASLPAMGQVSRLDKKYGTRKAQPAARSTGKAARATRTARPSAPAPAAAGNYSGLYNGESISLPGWFQGQVAGINTRLKEKLSPADFLEILKGEQYLIKGCSSAAQLNKKLSESVDGSGIQSLADLQKRLEAILADPGRTDIFARPRLVEYPTEGVQFREYLPALTDEVGVSDTRHILTMTPGLGRNKGITINWVVWNALTCHPEFQFDTPTATRAGIGIQETGDYLLYTTPSEGMGSQWSGETEAAYLLSATARQFQSVGMENGELKKAATGDLYQRNKLGRLAGNSLSFGEGDDENIPAGLYRKDYAGLEFIRPVEDTAWYATLWGGLQAVRSPRSGIIAYTGRDNMETALDLSTLARSTSKSEFKPQDKKQAFRQLQSILRTMPDAPYGEEPWSDEFGTADIGPAAGGYSLFTLQGNGYYSDGDIGEVAGIAGLLSSHGEAYLFTHTRDKADPYSLPRFSLPAQGKLIPYKRAVGTGAGDGSNTSPDVLTVPPRPKLMQMRLLEDGKTLEALLALETYTGNESAYLLHINTADMSYRTLRQWDYVRQPLCPLWFAEKKWLFRPESRFHYSLLQVGEKEDTRLADVYVSPGQGYAIVLPDGRYAGSPGCESFLTYGKDGAVVSMKALAPWRNRPGEVLEALGGNPDDIAALKATTQRWLKKQGFDPASMPAEPALGDFPAVDVQLPELMAEEATCRFTARLKATARDLARVEVRADGVLIPQETESDIPTPAGQQKEITFSVPLAEGQNWIEITPIDAEGIAGDPVRFRTIHLGGNPSDLYVVTLGVSDYDVEDLRLQYAAKDARDLARAFETNGQGRKHILTLTDKDVKDGDVLKQVKAFLAAASVDDRVILYVAGHGLLDEKLDYYYAPAGIDPENIAATGIPMDALTECLQSAKARHRLLLLDTCHSGSVGEADEDKLAAGGVTLPQGVHAVQNRGMKVKKVASPLNDRQKKRYIEDMFTVGGTERGINIIAGASGAEYALESAEWNNGVFTSTIMQALKPESPADLDKNGELTVEELLQYVSSAVPAMTGGAQRPHAKASEEAQGFALAGERKAMDDGYRPADDEGAAYDDGYQPADDGGLSLDDGYQPAGAGLDEAELATLDPLIARMAALKCKQASSALYQKRLLTLLPLIRNGSDVNITLPETKGNTALHYACAIGSLSIATWLVEHGADVNALTDKGMSPMDCIGSDNGPALRKLLSQYGAGNSGNAMPAPRSGASRNGDRSSLDPLIARMAALKCKQASSALYQKRLLTLLPLIRNGADVNITLPETKGNTALHYACAIGSLSIATWLVEHGADVNAVTDKGMTPLDCVGSDNGPALRKLLTSHGGYRLGS